MTDKNRAARPLLLAVACLMGAMPCTRRRTAGAGQICPRPQHRQSAAG